MMKSKVIRLIAFCAVVTLMIFSPAICNWGFEVYLDVTMKSTGKLPTVKTTEKLEKLIGERRNTSYIKADDDIVVRNNVGRSSNSLSFANVTVDTSDSLSAPSLPNPSQFFRSEEHTS
ncbi:MAG: hypothetical protein J6B11_10750, partial [Spirochaetales bacterium]|nr:hypothetical protein [Spirochaetales bacterium]